MQLVDPDLGRARRGARRAGAQVDAVDPPRVVDERVAVALHGEDLVVARHLLGVDGVLRVPLEQDAELAHVGHRQVAARRAQADQGLVVGQHQVGLGGAALVGSAFVAHVHVEQRARDVPAAVTPDLEAAQQPRGRGPVRVAGEDPAAAADAAGEVGGELRPRGEAVVEDAGAAEGAVGGVAQELTVAVRERVVVRAVDREAVHARPELLRGIAGVGPARLREAAVAVGVEHIRRTRRVGVGGFEHGPHSRRSAGDRDPRVVVDDVVQGRAQRGGQPGHHGRVVAGRSLRVHAADRGGCDEGEAHLEQHQATGWSRRRVEPGRARSRRRLRATASRSGAPPKLGPWPSSPARRVPDAVETSPGGRSGAAAGTRSATAVRAAATDAPTISTLRWSETSFLCFMRASALRASVRPRLRALRIPTGGR